MSTTFFTAPAFGSPALGQGLLRLLDQPARHHTMPSVRDARIQRGEQATTIQLDLPGVEPGDLSVEVDGAGTREQALVVGWVRRDGMADDAQEERGERRWSLAGRFDVDGISAEARNGVLRITLPHAEPPAKRTVAVTVGSAPAASQDAIEATSSEGERSDG